jgi:NAD(P)H-dependent FMN reductase
MRVMGMCGSLRGGSYNRAVPQAAVELAPEGMDIRPWDRLRVMPHSGLLVNFAAQKVTDGRLSDEKTRAFLAGFLEHFATWIRTQRGG